MEKKIQKKALTPREVAEAYGLCEATLAQWRYKKIGPRYYRINDNGSNRCKVIYMLEDIEAWVRQSPVLTIDSINLN